MQNERLTLYQLKTGSQEAFNDLYRSYFDLLYGFVFGLTRSHSDTKTIVQDAFIKVWEHRNTIDPEQSFKAWLYKISKNQLVDNFRKRINEPLFEDYISYISDTQLSINPDDSSYDFDLFRQSLELAKKKLTPRQLQAFCLCKELDKTGKEAALIMGITEQSLYNYLNQALILLRRELSGYHLFLFSLFFG